MVVVATGIAAGAFPLEAQTPAVDATLRQRSEPPLESAWFWREARTGTDVRWLLLSTVFPATASLCPPAGAVAVAVLDDGPGTETGTGMGVGAGAVAEAGVLMT